MKKIATICATMFLALFVFACSDASDSAPPGTVVVPPSGGHDDVDQPCQVEVILWVKEFRDGQEIACTGNLQAAVTDTSVPKLVACFDGSESTAQVGGTVFRYYAPNNESHLVYLYGYGGRATPAEHYVGVRYGSCERVYAYASVEWITETPGNGGGGGNGGGDPDGGVVDPTPDAGTPPVVVVEPVPPGTPNGDGNGPPPFDANDPRCANVHPKKKHWRCPAE